MKVHENHMGQKVVAVSDPEILSKHIEDSDKGIEMTVSKEFYGDHEFDIKEVMQFISHSENVNVVGNRIVETLIENGIIEPKNVIMIGGIKHAQIYSI